MVKDHPPLLDFARIRSELLENWRAPDGPDLAGYLAAGDAKGFDRSLLQFMQARKEPRFYFTPEEISERAAWIRTHLSEGMNTILERANAILQRRFPRDATPVAIYDVILRKDFSWLEYPTSDPSSVCALNRHVFWVELAMAYHFTGDSRYVVEFRDQFVSWCSEMQLPPFEHSRTWQLWHENWEKYFPRWHLLDAAVRAGTWTWTWSFLYKSEFWTPELNTLFLHRLRLHGEFLAPLTPRDGGGYGNHTILHAQGLLNLALLFPEFRQSAEWEELASDALTNAIRVQFRPDGLQYEQSPSYHIGSVNWLLEPLCLAQINGRSWASPEIEKLRPAAEAYYQMLHPDGTQPPLSDSIMMPSEGLLATLSLTLNEPKWMRFDQVTPRVVWLAGSPGQIGKRVEKRPETAVFPDSGYYVIRSGDGDQDCQLIFDCGAKGGWHGHFDLLSIELFGFGKELLCDPGIWPYVESTDERRWVRSTRAHNTISIDGENHAEYNDIRERAPGELLHPGPPPFQIDRWEVEKEYLIVCARHSAYGHLEGKPTVGRILWYDRRNTFVILDWGISETAHDYTVSYTFPGLEVSQVVEGKIATRFCQGNVVVCNLPLPGQKLERERRFWMPVYGQEQPAIRYTVSQTGKCVFFGHLIHLFPDPEPPAVTAAWEQPPEAGKALEVEIAVGLECRKLRFPFLCE